MMFKKGDIIAVDRCNLEIRDTGPFWDGESYVHQSCDGLALIGCEIDQRRFSEWRSHENLMKMGCKVVGEFEIIKSLGFFGRMKKLYYAEDEDAERN